MNNGSKKIILDGLGGSAPVPAPTKEIKLFDNKQLKDILTIDPARLELIHLEVSAKLKDCKTHREVLEVEVNALAECVGVATELYKSNPIPELAYQLSSLTNAHKSTLSQLEKMKDPKLILGDIENHIRTMFLNVVKAMAIEIDKTKKELIKLNPSDVHTIRDQFNRMLNAIQPETQDIYEELTLSLKKILGIKSN